MTGPPDPARQQVVLCELGALGVRRDGGWQAVRGGRTATLLAALALGDDSGVGTDVLIETIWPAPGQPPTARQSVANIVLRLRRSHGESFIESTRHAYRLGPDVQSDRRRFLADVGQAGDTVGHTPERALHLVDDALARWRGDPWLGIERPIDIEADRAHLIRMRTTALRIRATALIALHRRELAVADLEEMLADDPFDEFARYQLVRALADTGRRAAALRTIQEAHRLFFERGLALDAALVDEEQRLLDAAFASDAEMEPLPEQPTDFVGRRREIDAITGLLSAGRLVTIHGIGGSGKTRLAVHAARTFGDPARCGFVDLAAARSHAQVESAFARGLGLPLTRLDGLDTNERVDALTDAAASSSGVLVIDNCEQVVAHVRTIVSRLLARPGRLRMLATSRTPLDVTGERRYPIPPFTDAEELFRQRSADRGVRVDDGAPVDRGVPADDGVPETVARICDLVDHLPLAVEIAAAQTPYRTVEEIADELERGIVHRDASQAEQRHETMFSAIRWSHELLDDATGDALVRLGVFEAPFDHADAAAVLTTDDTSAVLDSLVRNSLIERSDHAGHSTYRLAVPVQQYCAAELERRGLTADVLISLAEWLLEFTHRSAGDVWWRLSTIDDIAPRIPHAFSAIGALRAVGRIDDATRLAGRCGGAARRFGHADALVALLTEPWPDCDDAEATAEALVALVICADAARRRGIVSKAVSRLDDLDAAVGGRYRAFLHCEHTLIHVWTALLGDGDFGPAEDELRRARDDAAAPGSPIDHVMLDLWQSAVHLLDGDWAAAEAAARRSLAGSADTVFDILATSCLCQARLQLGDPDEAFRLTSGHPFRNRHDPHGDLLGLAAAIALVASGDIERGLTEISRIQRRVRQAPFTIQQDDAAITIARIAHLLGHHDLAAQILDTGVLGYGPWIGYLVPTLCRELDIPLNGYSNTSVAEREQRSNYYGGVASRVLDQLCERQARITIGVRPRP